MLVVMTEKAEQLPVAAVQRIVVVIVILVMDREFAEPFSRKLPAAPGTDPGEYLESPLPIGFLPPRLLGSRFGDNPVHLFRIHRCMLPDHVNPSISELENL